MTLLVHHNLPPPSANNSLMQVKATASVGLTLPSVKNKRVDWNKGKNIVIVYDGLGTW